MIEKLRKQENYDQLSDEEIILRIEKLEAERDEKQSKIDTFFEELYKRQRAISAECGDVA